MGHASLKNKKREKPNNPSRFARNSFDGRCLLWACGLRAGTARSSAITVAICAVS
jgi:hypothetical protein